MNQDPLPEKKRRLTIISRITFLSGFALLVLALISLLALHINIDIIPDEAIGPHHYIGTIGQWLLTICIFISPLANLFGIIFFVAGFFKKPRVLNLLITFIAYKTIYFQY